MDIVSIVETIVRISMPRDSCHGYEHVERVRRLCRYIARKLMEKGIEVDLEVLELAALLHDIGRNISEERHAIVSAEIARQILNSLGYSKDKIEKVVKAILAHSYSARIKPETIEGAILSDADKLDALGAIGIARVFMYGGAKGRSIEDSIKHIEEKILKLPDLMYTEPGRELAKKRVEFVRQFLDAIRRELSEEG